MTVAPVVISSLVAVAAVWWHRRPSQPLFAVRLGHWEYRSYLGLVAVALIFFALGLDEEKDYMRIYHGLWHFLAGLGGYLLSRANERGLAEIAASESAAEARRAAAAASKSD